MKCTAAVFKIHRTLVFGLLSFVAVAALLGIAVCANRAKRNNARAGVGVANLRWGINLDQGAPDKRPPTAAAVTITATLTDNVTAATKVAPGGTINYTAVITNAGAASPADDALALAYNGTLDNNTTLVAGSVSASPVTLNDTYPQTVIGNVSITSANIPYSVITNDYQGQNGGAVTITAFDATTTGGGQIVMTTSGADIGKFTYNPPPGFEGTDTFTYTLTNSVGSSVGTVSIPVSGMIWFINNNAAACTTLASGCGRLSSPFSTLAAFQALNNGAGNNPAANDNIFVFESATTYTGGVTLLGGQRFIGQDATASLATITGLTPPTGSAPFPLMNTVGNATTLSGAGIVLNATNTSNTVRGMTITNTAGGKIVGTNFGAFTAGNDTLPDVALTGTGQALSLTNGSFANASGFNGVQSTSSAATGITLNQVASGGTVVFNGVQITSSTTQGIFVTLSTGSFNFGNTTIGAGAGTGGTDAITLQNNSAGSRTFGAVTIQNNSGIGFLHAAGGGVTNVTGTLTITNPGGRGVDIQDSTTAVTFNNATLTQSGGTGVFLDDNSGAVTFATLNITPDSGQRAFHATEPHAGAITTAGGTISTTNITAIEIVGTSSASRTPLNMQLTSVSALASGGNPATGIVLTNTSATGSPGGFRVLGNGGTCNEASPATCSGGHIQNTTGGDVDPLTTSPTGTGVVLRNANSISLTRIRINGNTNYGIHGLNVNSFTLADSVVHGVNGTNVASPFRDSSIRFDQLTGTNSITNSLITGGFQHNLLIDNQSGTSQITVSGCTIKNTSAAQGDDGFQLEAETTAVVNAFVTNNSFSAHGGDHFNLSLINSADVDLTFTGNAFAGGHPIGLGQGLFILGANFNGTFNYDISNNGTALAPLTGNKQGGMIHVNKGSGTGTFSGRIQNNFIGNAAIVKSGSEQAFGIYASARGAGGSHTTLITGNTVRQYFDTGIVTEAGEGAAAFNATVTNNTVDNFADAINSLHGIFSSYGILGTDTNAVCIDMQDNLVANAGNEAQGGADIRLRKGSQVGLSVRIPGLVGTTATDADNKITAENPNATTVTVTGANYTGGAACTQPTLPALPAPPQPANDSSSSNISSNGGAEPGVDSAIGPQLLPRTMLVARPVATMTSVAASAVKKNQASDSNGARLSHHRQFKRQQSANASAVDERLGPLSGEPVGAINIGTLPAGKSITIKYSATVNTTALTARQASTQGTITANGGAINVTTTDPGPPVVAGPTITQLDTTLTWTGATSTDWNDATNWNRPGPAVSSYAPGVSNPTVNDVIIPAVATQPTISATDIGIYSLSVANPMTLTITSPRVLTIGGSPGGDLTLDGIINGGNLNLGTGTHVINNAGGTGSLSSTNVATVVSGSTVTLNNNLQAGALAVNAGGSMNITNRTLSLNGPALVIPGGATFTTTGSTVLFNGTAAQQAAGIAYNNLTINNTIAPSPAHITGVTLTGNATVNGVLTLTSSDLATGAFTLTMPNTATSAPATGATDVVGSVTRTGFVSGGSALSFGNPLNTIRINSGTAPTSINILIAKNAPATYATAVQRSYTITPTGGSGITATVRLHYRDAELNGNAETPDVDFNFRRFTGGAWKAVVPTSRSTTATVEDNWLENNAVTTFSEWTFDNLAPTATSGSITGRIVDGNGNAVEGAVIRLNGTQNRKFITDANGFYRFDNVETNGFYTVTPSRVNYTFTPAQRAFSLLGEQTEAAFGAKLDSSGNYLNPLDTPEYFVRQHYLDFLGREPDEAGFNFWSDEIIGCGLDQDCVDRKRENVSAAYFFSIEFQNTGGFVDGLYRISYGIQPQFGQFLPDARSIAQGVIVGVDGWQAKLNANKQAFAEAFVNRPAFHATYDQMDNSLFVDTLISHTEAEFSIAARNALVSGLADGSLTRADALRSIAENQQFVQAKFNQAFVLMEYFGYLRRDPDAGGYQYWLDKLNHFNGNFEQAEMVRAFIVSTEYRDRFPK